MYSIQFIKTTDRFILSELIRSFIFIFTLFVCIAFVIIMFEDLDIIMENNATFGVGLFYFILKVPHLVVKATPMIVVITIVVTMANMIHHNELLMLYIAGYSPSRIAVPIGIALMLMIVMVFIFNETVSSPFAKRAHIIMETQIKKSQEGLVGTGGIWMHGTEEQVYRAGDYIPNTKTVMNLDIFEFRGENNTLSRRLHAETSIYNPNEGTWRLYNVIDHHFREDGTITRDILDEHSYYMDTTPDDFGTISQDPEEMSYFDIRKIVQDIRNAGESPREFLSHMRIKEAFPFAVFFLGIVSLGLILRYGLSGSASGIGIGLIAVIGYFLMISLGKSFADSGLISAWLGAWLPNIICIIISVYLFNRLRMEV